MTAAFLASLAGDSASLQVNDVDVAVFDANGIVKGINLRGFIDGFNFSTSGPSTTMAISAGVAAVNNGVVVAGAATSKTMANWAVGSGVGGKAQAAAIANNTSYHWYLIARPDTGVSDYCFSTNATGLAANDFVAGGGNIPAAYTQWRILGSNKSNGSAQWVPMFSNGDDFYLNTSAADLAGNAPTVATLLLLSIPVGRSLAAEVSITGQPGITGTFYAWSPSISATNFRQRVMSALAGGYIAATGSSPLYTDTSGRIYIYADVASYSVNIATTGWKDSRGRNT